MPEESAPYSDPRVAITRVYTRRGDGGETALAGGQRIAKDSPRIEAYGTLDELNAFVGAARESLRSQPALEALGAILLRVQHELFNLGSLLATLPGDVHPRQARIGEDDIRQLEREMDQMNATLAPLRSFVLPGGSRVNADLHVCRTICRRAERLCVSLARSQDVPAEALAYLNRLSDAFFVWSRWASHVTSVEETLWEPNRAASAQTDPRS